MELLVATGNNGKLKEMNRILDGFNLISLKTLGFSDEIEENGNSFYENALIKAQTVQKKFPDKIILADDSGLEIDVLNGRPGIYSARYAGANSSQIALINKVLSEMKDIPFENRGAQFTCSMVVVTPEGNTHSTTGICRGKIHFHPNGNNGFGYDPIFLPSEYHCKKSMAELSDTEKNRISHRFHALKTLLPILQQIRKARVDQ